jgi:hypothetical protein
MVMARSANGSQKTARKLTRYARVCSHSDNTWRTLDAGTEVSRGVDDFYLHDRRHDDVLLRLTEIRCTYTRGSRQRPERMFETRVT